MPDLTTTLQIGETLQALSLGLLLGAIGQGARAIVGLKKTADEASAEGTRFSDRFETRELVVSFLIGGIAGALAMIPLIGQPLTRENLTLLLAAGYAGTDFIEGFMRKAAPPEAASKQATQPATDTPDAPGLP